MHVRQMSISYQPEQDRILVRVNTSEERELQFWFTRRLTMGLAPLLERLTTDAAARRGGPSTTHLANADPVTRKAIADFKRSETIRGADFSTPYQVTKTNAPLFETPLLITEVNIATIGAGALRLQCSEKLGDAPQARKFELALSDTLTHAFLHLLERAVVASRWRDNGPPEAVGAPEAPAESPPPGYLN